MKRHLLTAVVLMFGACAPEDAVQEGAQLLVPVDVEFSWNEAYNAVDDGLVAVLPIDVMVYDGATGEPLFAEIEVGSSDARFIDPVDVGSGGPDCASCVWDAFRDQFVEFPADAPGMPHVVTTDADGLARVYALVDALPTSEDRDERRVGVAAASFDDTWFEDVRVRVAFGGQEEVVHLVPR